MKKYNIDASIIRAIENLMTRPRAQSYSMTAQENGSELLSPTSFFLQRIMCEALDEHEDSFSIGARLITHFRFADDMVVDAEDE